MTFLCPKARSGAFVTVASSVIALLVAAACSSSPSSTSTSPGGSGSGGGSGGGGSCPCTVGNAGIHFTIGCGQSECIDLNGQAIGYRCGPSGATEDPSVCAPGGPDSGAPAFDAGPACSAKSCSELALCGNAYDNCDAAVSCPGCDGGLLCSLGNHCEAPASNLVVIGNYQGGTFTIDVDEHLPNLGIGLVSYDAMQVTITGTYANDVVQVVHAGYEPGTTVTGIPASAFVDLRLPRASPDAGPADVIVDDIPGHAAGPTASEIVAFFQAALGGGTLAFHECQYNAYAGSMLVSQGGTCN